jgi:hypothetical protein
VTTPDGQGATMEQSAASAQQEGSMT